MNWSEQDLADYLARRDGFLKHGAEVAAVVLGEPVKGAKPVQREWRGQETIADFLDLALPATAFWSSIDMGPARSAAVGGLRKKRGLKAGLPDILVVYQRTTLWVECKTARGTLFKAQKLVRLALLANGHHYAQARSLDDVVEACRSVGIPLKVDVRSFGGAT